MAKRAEEKLIAEETLRKYLSRRGLRLTSERRHILKEVFSSHRHFETEDVMERLRARGLRVSRATVYRTLAVLVKGGLLREVSFGERHTHYEHRLGHPHHDHLYCLKCGKVIEFRSVGIESLQEQICKKMEFEALAHLLQISGYCKACRAK